MSNIPSPNTALLHDQRSGPLVDTAIAFIVVLTVATGLRIWSRSLQKAPTPWADTFAYLSWFFNMALCTCALLCVRYGAGKHIQTLTKDDLIKFSKVVWLANPTFYCFAATLPKLAILDLYLHIFRDKFSRRMSQACGIVLILSLVLNVSFIIGQCRPISKVWNRESPEGWCTNTNSQFTWGGLPNVFTDFIMLLLPLPTIYKLQQSWQIKLGMMVTFMAGSVGQITSIIRVIEFYKNGLHHSLDPTYEVVTVVIWTVVEPGTYHLAACFLTYRNLFRWIVYESRLATALSDTSLLSKRIGSKSSSNVHTKFSDQSVASTRDIESYEASERLEDGRYEQGLPVIGKGNVAKVEALKHVELGHDSRSSNLVEGEITVEKCFEIHSEPRK